MGRVMMLCVVVLIWKGVAITNGGLELERYRSDISTIYVDKSKKSSLPSIQAAIDSIPSNNSKWVSISVKAGVYKERVKIPKDKPFVYLKGEGMEKTSIVGNAHDQTWTSATFESLADYTVASGITFVNSYDYPPSSKMNRPVKPAVAAKISGNYSAFYKCGFQGYQDTLFDHLGKHYFVLCTIEGAIDFIFGNAQSIYKKCNISSNVGVPNPGATGCITAHGRDDPSQTSAFVFKWCTIDGNGHTFLGRAWRPYSRAIFYQSCLSSIVVPLGWDIMHNAGHEKDVTYVEEKCTGAGSNMSGRVKWEKTLPPKELNSFIDISYINGDGWIQKLPIQL